MRSQKGITILSLTVYIFAMTIVVAIVTRVSTFFYKNVTDIKDIEAISEYTTFNTYFTEEINTKDIKILECEENYIVFDNGVQYTFNAENSAIYRDKVKICENIEECTFLRGTNGNGKTTVTVNIKSNIRGAKDREPIVYTLR